MNKYLVSRMFHQLMQHYVNDPDKQFELMYMSDRDILAEHLRVFGTEEDEQIERLIGIARYCEPSVTLYGR